MAGLYVALFYGVQGAGSAFARHAVHQATAMGVGRLYLYTAWARGFYERLAWQPIGDEWYEGEAVTIMAIETALRPG